ncbi:MAG: sensor histidine kinase [Chloroflexota bacterium]
MSLSARVRWLQPYLILLLLLVLLLAARPPLVVYGLLVVPILLAATQHGLAGGAVAGSASAGLLFLAPGIGPDLFALVSLLVGPLAGWLIDRERQRERQRIHQLESERHAALAAIAAAGREIAASVDLDRTLRLVMQKAGETLPMDAGLLFRLDETTQRYRVLVSHNLPPDTVQRISFDFDEGVPGWVVRHNQPLIIGDARQDRRVHPQVVEEGVRSVLAVPLVTRKRVVGVLTLFCLTGPNAFDDQALQLAQVFADQAAVFIENARLIDELRRAASELEDRVRERTQQLEEAQAQVVRAEKLAAVGRLAASVAHEVNNPLQAIALHLQLVGEEPLSAEGREQLTIVQQELERITRTTQRLLDFQKPKPGIKSPQDIDQLLQTVLALAKRRLEQTGITVRYTADDDLLPVMAVGDQLQQVFLNLILNAVDAMPDGGELRIEAQQVGDQAQITFTDNGAGVAPDVLDKIFEPFFSTKHSGTGLGLAVSHGIVAEHGGHLQARSPVNDDFSQRPGAAIAAVFPSIVTEQAGVS